MTRAVVASCIFPRTPRQTCLPFCLPGAPIPSGAEVCRDCGFTLPRLRLHIAASGGTDAKPQTSGHRHPGSASMQALHVGAQPAVPFLHLKQNGAITQNLHLRFLSGALDHHSRSHEKHLQRRHVPPAFSWIHIGGLPGGSSSGGPTQ